MKCEKCNCNFIMPMQEYCIEKYGRCLDCQKKEEKIRRLQAHLYYIIPNAGVDFNGNVVVRGVLDTYALAEGILDLMDFIEK